MTAENGKRKMSSNPACPALFFSFSNVTPFVQQRCVTKFSACYGPVLIFQQLKGYNSNVHHTNGLRL